MLLPSAHQVFLALACVALVGMIAAQDWLRPDLRNDTISAGLTGPYHWWLDGTYLVLAVALVGSMRAHPLMLAIAIVSALALLAVAFTNTFAAIVDQWTQGQHAKWHSRATIVVFVSALLLQMVGDHISGQRWRWSMTVANVVVPAIVYCVFHLRSTDVDGTIVAASPAAEKLYVAGLCAWLIVWAL